ncbi:MAG: hypothetical protein ABDH20_11720 [Thermus sp.]
MREVREEAKRLLRAAQEAEAQGQLRLALLDGWLPLVWGGVFALGHALSAANPLWAKGFWSLAAPLATLLTFYLGFRQGTWVASERGLQTFALWGLLTLFALLHWLPLLPPKGMAGQSFLVSLAAFGLAFTGVLWRAWGVVGAGLGLFLLDLLLFRLLPQAFHPGMALAGLLALVYGAAWRRRWTP